MLVRFESGKNIEVNEREKELIAISLSLYTEGFVEDEGGSPEFSKFQDHDEVVLKEIEDGYIFNLQHVQFCLDGLSDELYDRGPEGNPNDKTLLEGLAVRLNEAGVIL